MIYFWRKILQGFGKKLNAVLDYNFHGLTILLLELGFEGLKVIKSDFRNVKR